MLIRLPWIGEPSVDFRREFQRVVCCGFPTVKARDVFTTTHAFSGRLKMSCQLPHLAVLFTILGAAVGRLHWQNNSVPVGAHKATRL